MEEAHRVAEAVFDEHAVSIAGNQLGGSGSLIGQENGRFVVPQFLDEEVTESSSGQFDPLFINPRGLILAGMYSLVLRFPTLAAQLFGMANEVCERVPARDDANSSS